MFVPCHSDVLRKFHQRFIDCLERNLFFRLHSADIAGDIQVIAVRFDLFHRYAPSIPFFFLAELIGIDDLVDTLWPQTVLTLALLEKFGALINSTSSGFLHFFKTRMHTGIPVEKNRLAGRPITVSMWPSFSSLVRIRSSTPPAACAGRHHSCPYLAWDNPLPAPFAPPFRNCPTDSAGTGKTACNRGSRPHSSPRAVGQQCPTG